MQPNTYLIVILAIIAIEFLTSLTISILDYSHKPTTSDPSIKKDYKKAKRYLRTNIKLGITKATVDTTILLIIILTGLLNNIDLFVRGLGQGPIATGIIFFGIIGAFLFLIDIPFSIYRIFVIEKKYGFNKTTKKTFIFDLMKTILGWIIIGAVGLSIILYFFQMSGTLAWFYCWIFLSLMQIFTIFIYPVFILPVFNRLRILQDGPLKEAIQNYLEKQNIDIKMDNIRIIDSSRRTNKSTAFLAGFGLNKRLVLSDTLLKNHTQDEIIAIVAHEVGHLKMNHILKKFILYTIETFLMMLLLSFIIQNNDFFLAFGVENLSVYLGLMLFSVVYAPVAFVFSTLTNYLSRKYEYMADGYAGETTSPKDMAEALSKLGSNNLTNPTPHAWSIFIRYSHPPIKNRIKKLDGLDEIKNGG